MATSNVSFNALLNEIEGRSRRVTCSECSTFNASACPYFPNVLPNAYACIFINPFKPSPNRITMDIVREAVDSIHSRYGNNQPPKPFPQPPPARILK